MHEHDLRYCTKDDTIYCMDCDKEWTEEEKSDIPWNYSYPKLGNQEKSYTYYVIVGDN